MSWRDMSGENIRQFAPIEDDEPETVTRVVRRDGRTVSPEQVAQEQEEQQQREREEAERKRREAPKILLKRYVPGEGVVTVAERRPDQTSWTSKEEKDKPADNTGPSEAEEGRRS